MNEAEIYDKYGVAPQAIGNRYRGYWVVDSIDEEEEQAGAQVGDLCVKTRDGGGNPLDIDSLKIENCRGTAEDGFDCTYRYYYYWPLHGESE